MPATPGSAQAPYMGFTSRIANAMLDSWLPTEGRTVLDIGQYVKNQKVYNVLDYGADPTGVADSTAAFHTAIAAAGATKGARVWAPDGIYAMNITITSSNVRLLANSGIDTVTANKFVPFDITKPVITIGSAAAAAFFFGVQLRDIAIMAVGPNGTGQVGLKIMAGGQRCSYDNIAINGFTKYGLRIESGTDVNFGSASRHYFDRVHIQGNVKYTRALLSADYNFGGAGALQYVTAVYFKNLSLNGNVWGVTGRTATSGAVGALNDVGQAWNVNEWAGMAVTIVSGTGIGQTRDIASNTATQLVPTVNFGVAPDNTSRYEIVGYCVENDGCELGFTDTYFDVTSWRSVRMNKDGATIPFLLCNNLNIDGATAADIVLDTYLNQAGSFPVSSFIIGLCNIDGYIRSTDGLTFHPTGRQYGYNQAQLVHPMVWGVITFQGLDSGDATSTNQMGPSSGHASVFQLVTESTITIKPGTGLLQLVAPAATSTFTLNETTGGFVGTLRCTGGLVQLYSQASKNLELIAGGSGSAAKLIINFNCGPILPTYTKATLPTAVAAGLIYVSDWPQGKRIAHFDSGTSWRPINNDHQASKGDADATFQYDTDVAIWRLTAALTAARTWTLSTAGTTPRGARFYAKRDAGGAFNLDIGPGLKTLAAAGTYAQFCFDSVNWYLEFSA